jgi:hypothetical protein
MVAVGLLLVLVAFVIRSIRGHGRGGDTNMDDWKGDGSGGV